MRLAEPELLFARFQQAALTAGGARAEFEIFVLDLVKAQMPDAGTVRGKGGRDWGIDVLVGTFSSGNLAIWQCKFVLSWDDDSPRGQIRSSFNSAVKHAKQNGYKIASWTLVVPCGLAPDERKWFESWAGRQRATHKVKIDLWDGFDLRHQLLREDVAHVRREYFSETVPPAGRPVEDVAETADLAQYDDALFVRQLEVAGETETDAARGLFYATDALVRDFEAKRDHAALEALKELHLDALQAWSHGFAVERPNADADGRMPALHRSVMDAAGARPDPAGLALRPVHKMGAVHRLVEAARAGWVTHWREVAAAQADTGAPVDVSKAGVKPDGGADSSEPEDVMTSAAGGARDEPERSR